MPTLSDGLKTFPVPGPKSNFRVSGSCVRAWRAGHLVNTPQQAVDAPINTRFFHSPLMFWAHQLVSRSPTFNTHVPGYHLTRFVLATFETIELVLCMVSCFLYVRDESIMLVCLWCTRNKCGKICYLTKLKLVIGPILRL